MLLNALKCRAVLCLTQARERRQQVTVDKVALLEQSLELFAQTLGLGAALLKLERAVGQTVADAVGHLLERLCNVVDRAHVRIELECVHGRYAEVAQKRRGNYAQHNIAVRARYGLDQIHKLHRHRVEYVQDADAAHAPQQREFQTYIAADVEGVIRVVPQPGVHEFLRCPADDQLEHRAYDHAAYVHQKHVILYRSQCQYDRNKAVAVDRADRPDEEAAVNKYALVRRVEDDLHTPAGKAVNEKQPQQLREAITQKSSTFLF